jgi:cytochrome c
MKFVPFYFCMAFVFLLLPHGTEASDIRGERGEAVDIVNKVVIYFEKNGEEETLKAVTEKSNPEFFKKDLYPFIYDLKGVNVAHGAKPHLVGKPLLELKDKDGVFLIREMVELAKQGKTGWVNYKWPDPATNSVTDKSSYISPLGDKYFVGVGVYLAQ